MRVCVGSWVLRNIARRVILMYRIRYIYFLLWSLYILVSEYLYNMLYDV